MFKKKAILTHEERISAAQEQVVGALDIFEKAKQDVQVANAKLDEVVDEAKAEIDKLASIIQSAQEKRAKNQKVIDRFTDLTTTD